MLVREYLIHFQCFDYSNNITLQSFNRNVLLNIQPLEYSNEPKHLLPWNILTTLLATQPRDYLQHRFNLLLQNENLVT